MVDRPVGTVKTWLHRARLELLERLRSRGLVPDEPSSQTRPPTAGKNAHDQTRTRIPVPPVPPGADQMDRLQLVLDGELPAAALDADPHAAACLACRERIAAARLCWYCAGTPAARSPLARGPDRLPSSPAVREDRYVRIRRRSYAVAGGVAVALAASVLLMSWLTKHIANRSYWTTQCGYGPAARPADMHPSLPSRDRFGSATSSRRWARHLLDTPKADHRVRPQVAPVLC